MCGICTNISLRRHPSTVDAMADVHPVTPTQGYLERPTIKVTGRNFLLHAILVTQVVLSVLVLGLTISLVATQPVGTSSTSQVNYTVFVVIFSLLGWFFIFIIAPRYDHLFPTRQVSLGIGLVTIIFYLGAALALTVAISPAGSCTDSDFVTKNKVTVGLSSRCRVVYADIVLLWLGMWANLITLKISFCGLHWMCISQIEG